MFRDLADASGRVPPRSSLGPPGPEGGVTLDAFCAGLGEVGSAAAPYPRRGAGLSVACIRQVAPARARASLRTIA